MNKRAEVIIDTLLNFTILITLSPLMLPSIIQSVVGTSQVTMLWMEVVSLFAMYVWIRIRKMPFRRYIKQDLPRFAFGISKKNARFLLWYAPLSYAVVHGGSVILTHIFGSSIASTQALNIMLINTMPLPLTFILTIIVAPVCEEWLFRGPMLMRSGNKQPGWFAVILSGTLFGLLHMPNTIASTWGYIVMGLTYAYAARHTKSVEAPIALHLLNNLIGFMLIIR